MSKGEYNEERLLMSTGDFHTHRIEVKVPKSVSTWAREVSKSKRVWTKSEINALVKCNNAKNFAHESIKELYAELESKSEYGSFEHSITKERSDFGIEFLIKRYFKLDGSPRSKCPFGVREERILKSFKRFTFVGLLANCNAVGSYRWFTPVYRVYSKSGEYFDYTQGHWGTPKILN